MKLKWPLHDSTSTFIASWELLNRSDRRRLIFVSVSQTFTGLLDLLGIALFGFLGALAIKGIQSDDPSKFTSNVLRAMNIENFSLQTQAAIIGILAGLILTFKTIFSVLLTRSTFNFLSTKCTNLASETVGRLFSLPLLKLQNKSSQSIVYAINSGITNLTLGILGSLVLVVSDFSLLLILFFGMLVYDPILALSTVLLFAAIAGLIHLSLSNRARRIGTDSYLLSVACNEQILEGLNSYREIFVKGRREMYVREISENRKSWGKVSGDSNFLPFISKYIIESSVLLGSLIVGAIQFAIHDAPLAAASLSIFLAAGTRIAPAVLRIQQSMMQMKVYTSSSSESIELIHELSSISPVGTKFEKLDLNYSGFKPGITIRELSYQYEGASDAALESVDFQVNAGETLAIVGRSGSGKTTLVDILLGLITPSSGKVEISGMAPSQAITEWPGGIAYVPQDVFLIDGTIRENITLGYDSSEITDEMIMDALDGAQLYEFVQNLIAGLDTQVGEKGTNLSGGQRQRLGIARAILTNPKLLVLDEATSALDSETELAISDSVLRLRGSTTIVIIAHRLSTVQHVDNVLYLDSGKQVSFGSFEVVRKAVPDFDRQAQLLGI